MAQAALIIFSSPNGRDNWSPIMPAAVPEWLKAPDTIARLVAGEMAMKADEGENGSAWYRAEPLPDQASLERIAEEEIRRAKKDAKKRAKRSGITGKAAARQLKRVMH